MLVSDANWSNHAEMLCGGLKATEQLTEGQAMSSIQFLGEAFLVLLQLAGGILGIVFISYLGVLIYDELTSRSNELYEHILTLAVGAEYLLHGRPKSKNEYRGRHRLNDPFISDLVVEMRSNPNSLCYNKTVAIDTEDELCGVF